MKKNLNLAIFWSRSVSLSIGFGLLFIVLLIYIFAPKNVEKEAQILIGMSIDSEERIDNLVKTNLLTLVMENGNEVMVSIPKSAPVRLGADVEIKKVKSNSGYENDYQYEFSKYVN